MWVVMATGYSYGNIIQRVTGFQEDAHEKEAANTKPEKHKEKIHVKHTCTQKHTYHHREREKGRENAYQNISLKSFTFFSYLESHL